VHEMFVEAHQEQKVPCSLIMCDLDHFKKVNDTYGHQAGDAAIQSIATLLKGACRPGDLVARYGGEEFVMLCADCDNAAAARRAEQVRKALEQMRQPKWRAVRSLPASASRKFSPATPRRPCFAARTARCWRPSRRGGTWSFNSAAAAATSPSSRRKVPGSSGRSSPAQLIEQVLVTPVPLQMTIEKLRGFVADHRATIVKIDGDHVQLETAEKDASRLRRLTDRPVAFLLDLRLEEERLQKQEGENAAQIVRTKITVVISLRKDRDRRRSDVAERAGRLLSSFRSYLMANPEEDSPTSTGTLIKAKRILAPWLARK